MPRAKADGTLVHMTTLDKTRRQANTMADKLKIDRWLLVQYALDLASTTLKKDAKTLETLQKKSSTYVKQPAKKPAAKKAATKKKPAAKKAATKPSKPAASKKKTSTKKKVAKVADFG